MLLKEEWLYLILKVRQAKRGLSRLSVKLIWMGGCHKNVVGVLRICNSNGGKYVGITGDDCMVVTRASDGRANESCYHSCINLFFLKAMLLKSLKHPSLESRPEYTRLGISIVNGALREPFSSRNASSNTCYVVRGDVVALVWPLIQVFRKGKNACAEHPLAKLVTSCIVLPCIAKQRVRELAEVQLEIAIRILKAV